MWKIETNFVTLVKYLGRAWFILRLQLRLLPELRSGLPDIPNLPRGPELVPTELIQETLQLVLPELFDLLVLDCRGFLVLLVGVFLLGDEVHQADEMLDVYVGPVGGRLDSGLRGGQDESGRLLRGSGFRFPGSARRNLELIAVEVV